MEMLKNFLQGKWLGHPLHPALVHLPTALWPVALLFDVLGRLGSELPAAQLSFWAMAAGLLAALAAAPTGYADFLDIRREKPAWKLGVAHMLLNLIATALQAFSLYLRWGSLDPAAPALAVGLSVVAVLILFASGYLGVRMIYAHGINIARTSKKQWRQIAEAGKAKLPPTKESS